MRIQLITKLVLVGLIASATSSTFAEQKTDVEIENDPEVFVWNFKTIEMVQNGSPENGKELVKMHKCSKCHGDTGLSDEDDTPSIAGQIPTYFFKQMMNYKNKDRNERSMHKASKKLGPREMADMAAFYASQESEPSMSGGKNPPKLVTEGDKSRLLLPCNVCHGKEGGGYGYESPALTGQRKTHFLDTMTEFRDGDRENDQYGRMRFIAKQLTEDEIEELANYYAAKSIEEEE